MGEMLPRRHGASRNRPSEGSPLGGVTPIEGDVRTRGALLATVVAAVAAAWLAVPRDVAVASAAACCSGTHGPKGYAYAGVESVRVASGVRATITPLRAASVGAGHAAAWIGVGGPGEGPKGETMWLQAGVAALPNAPAMLYAEITRPGQSPVFLPLAQEVPVGESHRLAVLEMAGRPGVWRIWVDGQPVTDPIALEGSHGLWKPIATAETWNGGTGSCNRFAFRFERRRGRALAGRLVAHARAGLHLPRPRPRREAASPDARPAVARRRADRAVRVRRALGLAAAAVVAGAPGETGEHRRPCRERGSAITTP